MKIYYGEASIISGTLDGSASSVQKVSSYSVYQKVTGSYYEAFSHFNGSVSYIGDETAKVEVDSEDGDEGSGYTVFLNKTAEDALAVLKTSSSDTIEWTSSLEVIYSDEETS